MPPREKPSAQDDYDGRRLRVVFKACKIKVNTRGPITKEFVDDNRDLVDLIREVSTAEHVLSFVLGLFNVVLT